MNELINEEKIKEERVLINENDIKIYENKNLNIEDYDFIGEDLNEQLNYLKEELFKNLNDKIGINYDLNYSQGSFFEFKNEETIYLNDLVEFYNKEKEFNKIINKIEIFLRLKNLKDGDINELINNLNETEFIKEKYEENFDKNDYLNHLENEIYYYSELTDDDKQIFKEFEGFLIEINKDFLSLVLDKENEFKNKGYEIMESLENEELNRILFNNFLEHNNINQDIEIYDLNYSNKKEKGFILIAKTEYLNLYIKPFKIKKTTFNRRYKEIESEVLI